MSRLADILGAKEPLFDISLKQLEKETGQQGADIKLLVEISNKASWAHSALGLPGDSSARFLYEALIRRVAADNDRLANLLGGNEDTSLNDIVPKIIQRVEELDMPRRGYFLKTEVAINLLRETPPKSVIARLGYSDVTAMLARENVFEIFGALRFAEDARWLNNFASLYKKLKPKDFENRNIRIVRYDAERWGDIASDFIKKKLHNITHLKEMGVIMVMPTPAMKIRGATIKILPLILHYYNEIRLYSAFFRLISERSDFGSIVADTIIADPAVVPITGKHYIHWRVIQRYFGKLAHEDHPEIFEPHVQPEDLHWRHAEKLLAQIDPEMAFWQHMDFVAAEKPAGAVSLNLMDVALSYCNELSFEDRYVYHMRESLWNEIFARYMGWPTLRRQILERLNNGLIRPENIAQ